MPDLSASDATELDAQQPQAANDSTRFAIDVEPLRGCRRASTRHRPGTGTAGCAELQAVVMPLPDGSPYLSVPVQRGRRRRKSVHAAQVTADKPISL